nr:MAG TPA: hypothetical protein [Caudoviricetes sp.]
MSFLSRPSLQSWESVFSRLWRISSSTMTV